MIQPVFVYGAFRKLIDDDDNMLLFMYRDILFSH